MKSNLLKTLVTLCLVLGVSSCTPKKPSSSGDSSETTTEESTGPVDPINLTLAGAWEREAEPDENGNYPYANVGKEVIIKNLAVSGLYGNTYVLNQNHEAPSKYTDFSGIEATLKEGTESTAWVYDVVTVQGRLEEEEERVVLKDAVLEITRAAWTLNEDGTRTRNKDADGNNIGSIYYVKADSRSIFNRVTAPLNSGALADIYVQFATLPGEFSTTKGTSFYVVYPGENLDVDDPDNESLIEVRIPAGLPQKAIDRFNAYLNPAEGEAVKVGDFAIITGCLEYHTFSQGLVMEYFFSGFEAFSEEPEIYGTFAEMYNVYGGENVVFHEGMVDFKDDLDKSGAFSFVPQCGKGVTVGDEYGAYEEKYPEIFDKNDPSCEVFIENWKTAAYFEYVVNTKNLQASYEAASDALEAAGFVSVGGLYLSSDQTDFVEFFLVFEGEGDAYKTNPVTHQVSMYVYNEAKQLGFEEYAEAPFYEGDVEAALTAMYTTNNATLTYDYYNGYVVSQTKWSGDTMSMVYAVNGELAGGSTYSVIRGKFETDGVYKVGADTEGNPTFTLALELPAEYGLGDVLDGAPQEVAFWMQAGTLENGLLTVSKAQLEAFALEVASNDETKAAKYYGYAMDAFLGVLAPVFDSSDLAEFTSVAFSLCDNNTYKFTVNFSYSYQGNAYDTTEVVYFTNVGTTVNAIDAVIEALPDYVPEEPTGLSAAIR